MLESFVGTNLPAVLRDVRAALGDDACVVDVSCTGDRVEVFASRVALTAHPFRRRPADAAVPLPRPADASPDPVCFGAGLASPPLIAAPPPQHGKIGHRPAPLPVAARRNTLRPPVVALVGPTGVGKTTTLAKLATHPGAFGGRSVGIIGMDTYRVGAVEQLETYAELAGLPCEVVHVEADLDHALVRLLECDIILVDTPGRGPRQVEDLGTVRRWLARLAPDEVHLALPASNMPQALRRTIAEFASFGVTHALGTKLDECPHDARVFDVVASEGMMMRWFTDGQEVPADLHPATDRMDRAVTRLAARRRAEEVFA
ncbi:MAG: hypothetical protein U0974_04385 [Gemmatimonadales bacterium]|nr:hypothetical protein [Gemmatimonadales bacterium]MDZ4388946.1 hypothetical protein [Gemmatimonadales bacterium]